MEQAEATVERVMVRQDMLDTLERKVEAAVTLIGTLRTECEALRSDLEAAQSRTTELESSLEGSTEAHEAIDRLEREKNDLLHDRAVVARRVESLIEKLAQTGLE
jgi:FtsZ-binding cell division protein ZapB